MLDTVRAYAARELAASDEREAAMEGLVRYIGTEAALAAEGLIGPAQVKWLNRTREDFDSYRGALAWLVERGRADEAAHIASVLMTFWAIGTRVRRSRVVRTDSQLAEPAACCRVQGSQWHRADALHARRTKRARAAIERALSLALGVGDSGQVALAHNLLGHVELGAGNFDVASDLFRRLC